MPRKRPQIVRPYDHLLRAAERHAEHVTATSGAGADLASRILTTSPEGGGQGGSAVESEQEVAE